ncbi:hypothetical protein K435DRAFT_865402 [Dendrothele bispora CBS 962.96]|uniref:Uncharacterized protein n=1 Tax=Dendrothele bispora (strain CBS 962.96) TaxID=1314807 RepID=A0A4S8LJW3_DENBC|nr:hypothetical protein K435DRAFT_865402 [Dendrothele bispora CBS 962.96]
MRPRQKRKVAPFRAFVSRQMGVINSDIPEGEPRKKVPECIGDIAKKWGGMSEEERADATTDAMKEIEEKRENRELASHNSLISAFHDVRTTMEDAKLMLQRLNSRTGAESIIITVRSNSEHFNPPDAWVTSDSHLEGYCISGVEGVARNYVTETTEMKKELVKLIADKLRAAGGKTHITHMYYKNFDDHITAKYGVKIVNWPLEKFCCPSELSTRVDIQVLRNAWESGTTYFYKMTSSEWKEWDEKRFENALENEPASTSSPNEPVPTSSLNEPVPTSSPNEPVPTLSPNEPTPTLTPNEPAPTPSGPAPASTTPASSSVSPDNPDFSKRGRKQKALSDATEVDFLNTTAVTGLNGEILMQKPARKRQSDAGKARGKKGQTTGNEENHGTA